MLGLGRVMRRAAAMASTPVRWRSGTADGAVAFIGLGNMGSHMAHNLLKVCVGCVCVLHWHTSLPLSLIPLVVTDRSEGHRLRCTPCGDRGVAFNVSALCCM